MPFEAAARIAEAIGVSLDWLATGEGPVLARERQVVAPQGPREFDAGAELALANAIKAVQRILAGAAIDPERQAQLIGELFRANLRGAKRAEAGGASDGDAL